MQKLYDVCVTNWHASLLADDAKAEEATFIGFLQVIRHDGQFDDAIRLIPHYCSAITAFTPSPEHYALARSILRPLADAKSVEAMYALHYVEREILESADTWHWLRAAAAAGHSDSVSALANLVRTGKKAGGPNPTPTPPDGPTATV